MTCEEKRKKYAAHLCGTVVKREDFKWHNGWCQWALQWPLLLLLRYSETALACFWGPPWRTTFKFHDKNLKQTKSIHNLKKGLTHTNSVHEFFLTAPSSSRFAMKILPRVDPTFTDKTELTRFAIKINSSELYVFTNKKKQTSSRLKWAHMSSVQRFTSRTGHIKGKWTWATN